MRNYETLYILRPDLEEEASDAIIARFNEAVARLGGTIVKTDKWGKKRLAYEIKDQLEGFYVLTAFQAPHEVSQELDRLMRITDEILRHLIVKQDED